MWDFGQLKAKLFNLEMKVHPGGTSYGPAAAHSENVHPNEPRPYKDCRACISTPSRTQCTKIPHVAEGFF